MFRGDVLGEEMDFAYRTTRNLSAICNSLFEIMIDNEVVGVEAVFETDTVFSCCFQTVPDQRGI